MEVHHPHHPTHKKEWKEYITEFLMLFIAVTLGFFVENLREHYVEDQRGLTYAKRLLDDLKEDSARLDLVYNSAGEKVDLITSIIPYIQDEHKTQQAIDSFYYFGFWNYNKYGYIGNLTRFYRVEETIDELKAGNLRLIKSDSVVAYLAAYSRKYNVLNQVIEIWQERSANISKLHAKMFDKTYYLLHEDQHPKTYPIFYRDVSKDNVYEMKTELLGYRINMKAMQANVITLRKINKQLMFYLTEYLN